MTSFTFSARGSCFIAYSSRSAAGLSFTFLRHTSSTGNRERV